MALSSSASFFRCGFRMVEHFTRDGIENDVVSDDISDRNKYECK